MSSPNRAVTLAVPLALLLGAASAQESFAPVDGEVFPEMSFTTLDGEGLASLADFSGRKVLLMQFASW